MNVLPSIPWSTSATAARRSTRATAPTGAGPARLLPRFFPPAARPLVPALDWLSHRSLTRSAVALRSTKLRRLPPRSIFPGMWLLNASYQWGCTARAGEQGGTPWLARTLDWPFRGLGHHTELAHMRGRCGDFVSVTWPGYVGVLTAMAPRRFGAALNQAPMWRRTRHRWLRPFDYAANALRASAAADRMPPDQLLRQAFEELRGLCRCAAPAGKNAGRASGDLHACRLRSERTLRDRADRNRLCHPRPKIPPPPTTGCPAARAGRAASGCAGFLVSSFAEAAGYQPGAARSAGSNGAARHRRADFDWVRSRCLILTRGSRSP